MIFLIVGENNSMDREIMERDINAMPNFALSKMNKGIDEEKLDTNNPRKYSSNFCISFISETHVIV